MGAGRGAQDYRDEPTLPEDLEDDEFPILRPAPAPVLTARCVRRRCFLHLRGVLNCVRGCAGVWAAWFLSLKGQGCSGAHRSPAQHAAQHVQLCSSTL
jgi:hypothetical protein